jgi:hypothetical protein
MLQVKLNDDTTFTIGDDIVKHIGLLAGMMEAVEASSEPTPLPNVTRDTLQLLVQAISMRETPELAEMLHDWSPELLVNCIEANRILSIACLEIPLAEAFDRLIRTSTTREIQTLFSIEPGFTDAEQKSLTRQVDAFFRRQEARYTKELNAVKAELVADN